MNCHGHQISLELTSSSSGTQEQTLARLAELLERGEDSLRDTFTGVGVCVPVGVVFAVVFTALSSTALSLDSLASAIKCISCFGLEHLRATREGNGIKRDLICTSNPHVTLSA